MVWLSDNALVLIKVARLHYWYTGRAAVQACGTCADMGMTYLVIVQCTDCVVFPIKVVTLHRARLASGMRNRLCIGLGYV